MQQSVMVQTHTFIFSKTAKGGQRELERVCLHSFPSRQSRTIPVTSSSTCSFPSLIQWFCWKCLYSQGIPLSSTSSLEKWALSVLISCSSDPFDSRNKSWTWEQSSRPHSLHRTQRGFCVSLDTHFQQLNGTAYSTLKPKLFATASILWKIKLLYGIMTTLSCSTQRCCFVERENLQISVRAQEEWYDTHHGTVCHIGVLG